MNSETTLPPFIMTSERGSFAPKTIVQRKPKIIEEVIRENTFPHFIVERLSLFGEEILEGTVQPLTARAPDVEQWNTIWQEFENRTWLELPWYFAEAYFYRRLLEVTQYFQPGPLRGRDPFQESKRRQLRECIDPLDGALDALEGIGDPRLRFENLLHASLWGNRVDLSNITVEDEVRRCQAMIEKENLLINDFPTVLQNFEGSRLAHVAFVNDNAGMELAFDLFLADFLLRNNWVDKITFYLKPYPFFVSDAMPKDLKEMIGSCIESSKRRLGLLGSRVETALAEGEICMSSDWFWASAYHFREMPSQLYDELSRLDMVILKGDVNYRRLLSDRHWPYTTPTEEIVAYFPTSLLILRTLKGEIIVGLKKGQAEKTEAEDPEWLINGKRGILQYIEKASH